MTYVKRIFIAAICVCSFQLLSAQTNYTSYTIKKGETLSVLAKKYNTTIGDIMRLNGMHTDSKINAGDKIKIPSKANVTVKKETVSTKETVTTVTKTQPSAVPANSFVHTVAKGETLFSISKKYGVSVQDIKTWNHLTSDYAKAGSTLILARNTTSNANAEIVQTPPVQKQRVETTAVQQPQPDNTKQNNAQPDNANTPTEDTATQNNFATVMSAPLDAQVQANAAKEEAQQPAAVNNYSGEGYFAGQFKNKKDKNLKTVSGISKTFKTASGWADGKYYILANDIEPGTIVKITTDNGASVYAKVLWNMGDLKDNASINFRVSNATAAALHEDAGSFNLNVSF